MRRTGLCVGGLAALTLLAGCNTDDKSNLSRDVGQLAKSGGEALGNATVAGKVNGVLSVWKGIDMTGWSVEAKDGVVTLTGKVRNKEERARILNVVNQIRDVKKVVNNLEVEK